MGQASHEPSMEDILASIKRIIAEDSEAVGARPARIRREAIAAVQSSPAILRTVDPEQEPEGLPEEGATEDQPGEAEEAPVAAQPDEAAHENKIENEIEQPEAEPAAMLSSEPVEQTPEDVLELTSPMPEAKSETADTAAQPENQPATAFAAGIEGLVTGPAAAASRSAFATLTQLQVRSEEGKSNTLEGLVSDLLRPMLREWLDQQLPAIVERAVQAEVRRLSGGA